MTITWLFLRMMIQLSWLESLGWTSMYDFKLNQNKKIVSTSETIGWAPIVIVAYINPKCNMSWRKGGFMSSYIATAIKMKTGCNNSYDLCISFFRVYCLIWINSLHFFLILDLLSYKWSINIPRYCRYAIRYWNGRRC